MPSTEVHTAATAYSSLVCPTAIRPASVAVTPVISEPPKTALSWGTRVQVIPSTEVQTAASVMWPLTDSSCPTATKQRSVERSVTRANPCTSGSSFT